MTARRIHGVRVDVPSAQVFKVTDGGGGFGVTAKMVTWIHGDECATVFGPEQAYPEHQISVDVPIEELPTWVLRELLETTTGEVTR